MELGPITRRPLRLLELADQPWFPSYFRAKIQETLTLFWTHRIPLIQARSPAEVAAEIVLWAVEEFERASGAEVVVVDFCSGGGGPIPAIERLVNERRRKPQQPRHHHGAQRQEQQQQQQLQRRRQQQEQQAKPPLHFVLSDLHPHVQAWKDAAARSRYLGYVPTSVDATAPTQQEELQRVLARRTGGSEITKPRVFRLFCLSFHHFDDDAARKILLDAMQEGDGFGIIELQSRTISTMVLMAFYLPTILIAAPFWFGSGSLDAALLFFMYIVPVIPFALVFDGIVSALRTRTPDEILRLIFGRRTAFGDRRAAVHHGGGGEEGGGGHQKYVVDEWVFEAGSEMHSWPVGYLEWFVGRKLGRQDSMGLDL